MSWWGSREGKYLFYIQCVSAPPPRPYWVEVVFATSADSNFIWSGSLAKSLQINAFVISADFRASS